MSQDRRSIQWLQLNLQLKFDRTRNEFMNLTHLHAFPNAIQRKDLKVMLTHMGDDIIFKTSLVAKPFKDKVAIRPVVVAFLGVVEKSDFRATIPTLTPAITPENRGLTHAQQQYVIDYIHTHLDQDLSLVEIAKVINISPTYFASLFKRAIGISPHQYVIQQRVERAKVMLSKTDLAIADIALQVGFSSQSHLTQQFKRRTGMTPKQVRP
jgi:AraC-like DNA-binding protein